MSEKGDGTPRSSRHYLQLFPGNLFVSHSSICSRTDDTRLRRARDDHRTKISRIKISGERNTHDAEYRISLATVLDSFINHSVFGRDFIGACFCEVSHSGIIVAEVYLRDALVEKDFGRIEFEFESQLFVIAEKPAHVSDRTHLVPTTPGTKVPKGCVGSEGGLPARVLTLPGFPSGTIANPQSP